MILKRNMGGLDRALRIAIGLVLILFGFVKTAWMPASFVPTLLGIFGMAMLIAALLGVCPAYVLARVNTRPESDEG